MKTMVIGEFKALKAMEKLMVTASLDYMILGDLETLEEEEELLESFERLLLYLNHYDTFRRYYPFIQRNRHRMVLWLKGRELKKYEEFLRNSGYATIRCLKDLKTRKPEPVEKQTCGHVVGLYNSFGVGVEIAYHQGSLQQVLLMDLVRDRPPSGFRLEVEGSEPRRYLTEAYDLKAIHRSNSYGNFYIIGYPEFQKGDRRPQEESFLDQARADFDLVLLNEPRGISEERMEGIIYTGTLDHESLEEFLKRGLPREKTLYLAVYDQKRLGDVMYLKKKLGAYSFKLLKRSEVYNFMKPFELINLRAISPKSSLSRVLEEFL
ncbi:MAG: hypothetical protein AVO33_03145 [delta proteobacterium ML8_F1]|nr:MAG: hypothetical protein AVO33_03145 [delta proteobacterium ML8_F1]